jgi:hypothetical protein
MTVGQRVLFTFIPCLSRNLVQVVSAAVEVRFFDFAQNDGVVVLGMTVLKAQHDGRERGMAVAVQSAECQMEPTKETPA